MSHTSKSKAKGISASSFFDLKAELSKQEADFAKAKGSGKSTAIIGGVKRPDKVHYIIVIMLITDRVLRDRNQRYGRVRIKVLHHEPIATSNWKRLVDPHLTLLVRRLNERPRYMKN
jgi:hypothetical protein